MATSLFRLFLAFLLVGAQEGRIRKIRFEGNRHFLSSKLANTINTVRKDLYSEADIVSDSADLVRFYRNQGFPWVKVGFNYEADRGRLTYEIIEGERLHIERIRTSGASNEDADVFLSKIPIRRNSPLTAFGLSETQRITKRYYQERGYPYPVVTVDTASTLTQVDIKISVVPGTKAYISKIDFLGVPDSVINHKFIYLTTRLKSGELYSISRLDKASRFLYATSLFSKVDISPSRTSSASDDSLNISFQLSPARMRSILLGAGIETSDTSFIPDRFLLSVGWEHINLFHRGVSFSVQTTVNPTFRGNYDMSLNITNRYPFFLPWGIALSLAPYFENSYTRPDSLNPKITSYTVGGEVGLEKEISEKLLSGISLQIKRNWSFIDTLPYSPIDQIGRTNFMRIYFIYDSRNDFFNPSSGIFFYPYFDWAGSPLGGDNHFARFYTDFRNYLALPFKSVLAWRIRAGIIVPHSGMNPADISHYEKFTLGGPGSVRALPPKSIGPDVIVYNNQRTEYYGTFLLANSIEIRTSYAFGWVGFAFFLDEGICARGPNDIGQDDWGWGPGVGLRINTPIGPVRLDYAKSPRTPYQWPDNIGRFELGFLHSF